MKGVPLERHSRPLTNFIKVLVVNGLFFWRSHPLTATWFITTSTTY